MARPKEKIPASKTKTLLDRCRHEKENLKKSVIKQLQKDIGNLLEDETHSDLSIRAGDIDIKVHKFILKARCPAIYDRFVELSIGKDLDVLVMPQWVTYNTALFIIRRLYFVETDPLDESVDKQDEVLMDYLRSLLFQRKNEENSSVCESETDLHENESVAQKESHENESYSEKKAVCENETNGQNSVCCEKNIHGHNIVVNNLDKDNALLSNLEGCSQTENSQEENLQFCDNKKDLKLKNGNLNSDETHKIESVDVKQIPENLRSTTLKDSEDNNINNGSTNVDSGEVTDTSKTGNDILKSGEVSDDSGQQSVSNLIKLSYGLALPYEACNRVGEDLLRGYLQEMDTDCQITVSGDHFKVHKCILSARSSYFAAMLGGSWRETNTDINLEGVSPSVVEQLLLYLYGGVVDIIDTCSVEEFVMSADMYGLEAVKVVANSFIRREYCHMFHKICPVCEELLPEALTIAAGFHMNSLKDKCVEWINRNMVKMWRSKFLGKQPQEMLDLCYNKAVEELNGETAIETLLDCQNLNHNIPRLRWSEPLLCLITKLNDSAIEFISCNFIAVLQSTAFHKLDKGLGYKISLLEETFEAVIKSLPVNKACEVYHSLLLKQIEAKENLEQDIWSMDYCNFINFLFTKCEDFLKLHVHKVINTSGWELLSKDTKSKLLEGGSFVFLENTIPDPKKVAKARTEARRNYVPLVRKVNKISNVKTKSAQQPKTVTNLTKVSHSMKLPCANGKAIGKSTEEQREATDDGENNRRDSEEQREATDDVEHKKRDITGDVENNSEEFGAVGGILSNENRIARTVEEFFFNMELAESLEFTAELIPILNFTFHCS